MLVELYVQLWFNIRWMSLPPCQLPKVSLGSAGSNQTAWLSRVLIYIYIYIYISILIYKSKVYNFINWWNKNLNIVLLDFDVFIRKLGLIFKLGQLIGYLVRNIFMEKSIQETCTIASFKVCVSYFLTSFYFSPNNSPSKTMEDVFLFHLKSSFRSQNI